MAKQEHMVIVIIQSPDYAHEFFNISTIDCFICLYDRFINTQF